MKTICIAFFLFLFINSNAQVNPFVGTYFLEGNAINAKIAYSLSLEADGTFLMHFYRKLVCDSCVEENWYGSGKWASEKNIVTFLQEKQEEKNSINLHLSKARIDTKSPRNLSDKIVKTKLTFYDSDVFWVKGLKLYKKD